MEPIIKVQTDEERTSISSPNKLNNLKSENVESFDRLEDITSENQDNQDKSSPCVKANPIIFQNYFTLQINKPSIQAKFDEELYRFSKLELFFFMLMLLMFFTGYSCYVFFNDYIVLKTLKRNIDIYNIVAFVLAASSTIMYILKNIYKSNIIIAKIYKYLSLAFLTGLLIVVNNTIYSFFEDGQLCKYYFFFYFGEFAIQITYLLVVDCEFIRSFIVHLTYIVVALVTSFLSFSVDGDILIKTGRLITAFTVITFICYFYDKFCRKMFYLSCKVETQNKFYLNLLNNMQNGIFVYNNLTQKIKFLNSYLSNYDEFNKQPLKTLSNSPSNSTKNRYFLDEKLDNYNIFNYVIDPNKTLPNEVLNFMGLEKFTDSAEQIYKYFLDNKDEFPLTNSLHIGHIKLIEKGNENLFEFYLRHIETEDSSYLEFMLNNVTYTKIHEIEKIKQKTQILARISHEFKNPLIVSSEIIDEIEDSLKSISNTTNNKNTNEIRHNLTFLKNLSLYMLILVKDFEVISSIENNIDNCIYAVKVNLIEYTKEIQEIVEALIKKKNSINPLNFLVNIDNSLRFFCTDIMRLKQILINLISNSIKFTEVGYIELKIEKLESINDDYSFDYLNKSKDLNKIKISVIDTGKGITKEKQQNLFNSLIKEMSTDNILGAGYGLGIVKNLCSMLGTEINYSDNDPKGSIFYFTLQESILQNEDNNPINLDNFNNLNNDNELNICNNKLQLVNEIQHNPDDDDINFIFNMNECCLETIKNINVYTSSTKEINKNNKTRLSKRMVSVKINQNNQYNSNTTQQMDSQRFIETSRQDFNLSIHPSYLNIISNISNERNEGKI